jgi:hypothetical protein
LLVAAEGVGASDPEPVPGTRALLIHDPELEGSMRGAMLGVGLGFAYTKIFNVSNFEGYSGMLVFFTFMPLGAIVGGIGGAVLLGIVGSKK